jgi:hypothetical protein
MIITPEPLVGWGYICALWKGLKIIYHFNIVYFFLILHHFLSAEFCKIVVSPKQNLS